jgi:hypothetical protein
MIEVKVKSKSKKDFVFKDMNEFLDDAISEITKGLEKDFKNTECEIHKSESFGTILINAENGKIEYGEFCCDKFKPNL